MPTRGCGRTRRRPRKWPPCQERNRLARELHDAATQTVFSITLTAQAARMACDSDPARLPELLDRIQESSADALAEMRGLVSELRPRRVAEDGLVPTLRQHFAMRERRERLRTIFSIEGEERGSLEREGDAPARRAGGAQQRGEARGRGRGARSHSPSAQGEVVLRVRDTGKGFDAAAAEPAAAGMAGGFGLASMKQRVEAGGGAWQIVSRPGRGTEVTVRMPLPAEGEHDGQEPADQGPDR